MTEAMSGHEMDRDRPGHADRFRAKLDQTTAQPGRGQGGGGSGGGGKGSGCALVLLAGAAGVYAAVDVARGVTG